LEEEINLRELIDVLLKGKWIIVGICIVAVLAAGLISFFVLPEKYEASATIMVNNMSKEAEAVDDGSLGQLLGSLTEYPSMTLETYRDQIKNPALLQGVIDELKLDPEQYTVHGFREGKVKAEAVEKTNLIRIKVTDQDPATAAAIANSLADNFVEFVNNNSKERLGNSVQFLEEQIGEQEKEMAAAVDEYKEFLAKPAGVEELQKEFNAKLTLLTDFKNQLVQNEVKINKNNEGLKQVQAAIAEIPQKLVTEKSLAEDPYLFQVAGEVSDKQIDQLSGISMKSEEINPVYIDLVKRKVTLQEELAYLKGEQVTLRQNVSSIGAELEQLQSELAEKKVLDQRLSSKVDMLRDNYEALVSKYQETKMSASAQIGEASIMLLSEATKPDIPVAPRKMLNVAVAGVLGLMLSVFFVFFREFWRNSEPEKIKD